MRLNMAKNEVHLHFSSYCKQLTMHFTLIYNLVKKKLPLNVVYHL